MINVLPNILNSSFGFRRDGSAGHTYYYASEKEAAEDIRTFLPFKHISFGKNHYDRRLEQVKRRTQEIGRVVDFLKDLNDGKVSRNVLGDVPGERGNSFDLNDLIGKLDLASLSVMGHSFGGSTALYALYARQEFRYRIYYYIYYFKLVIPQSIN